MTEAAVAAPIGRVRRAAIAFGLVAFGFLVLNPLLRIVCCVDGVALGLIGAMGIWAAAVAHLPSVRRAGDGLGPLVDRRWLAASAATIAVFLLLDVFLRFEFLLLGLVLLLALLHLIGAVATLGAAGARPWRGPGPGLRALGLVAALLVVTYVSVTKLSALGAYQLVGLTSGGGPYQLSPSPRAGIGPAGFRGSAPTRTRSEGVARVAVVGDSATYGWLVSASEAFPELLARELALRRGGHAVEVLNAGVPGYDLPRMIERLRSHVAPYHPDLVVLVTGANDRDMVGAPYQARLDSFVDAAQALGARVVLTTYPTRRPTADRLARERDAREVAKRRGLRCVDLATLSRSIPRSFFLPEGHPSASGHRAMAAVLAGALDPLLAGDQPRRGPPDPRSPAPR